MENSLAAVYLGLLVTVLAITIGLLVRQITRTRKTEATITRLRSQLGKGIGSAQEHFELGSIYLSKKLPIPAIEQFKKAIKAAQDDEEYTEDLSTLYNVLGYAYFSQDQYDLAIRNYKEALERQPQYVVAMNNLAHAYEKKKLYAQALSMYEQALDNDEQNSTAQRRVKSLRRRVID